MCGIAGFVDYQKKFPPEVCVDHMTESLFHRGPDGRGTYVADKGRYNVALGHRRLSIVDLSHRGSQPMAFGKSTLVYNGEIYNFKELREQLAAEGCSFKSKTDTEVLLRALDKWGIGALGKMRGMFAFAFLDEKERVLYLARDRMGEKPLYYGWSGKTFFFTSELKALRKHPGFIPKIDRRSLAMMVKYKYIPCPGSIYENIKKLPPGYVYKFFLDDPDKSSLIEYWSVEKVFAAAGENPLNCPEEQIKLRLKQMLQAAVKEQMYADVPLGAFLSGGVDSSLIVSIMEELGHSRLNTFSIGFRDKGYDEAPFARGVSEYLDIDHTERYFTEREFLGIVGKLPEIYDEPFADPAQLPAVLLSETARQKVKVVLSGDGGDELFFGYDRYRAGRNLWGLGRKLPFKKELHGHVEGAAKMAQDIARSLPFKIKGKFTKDRIARLAYLLLSVCPMRFYEILVSNTVFADGLVLGDIPGKDSLFLFDKAIGKDFYQIGSYMDMVSFLPDDILVKVDRSSMSEGLETRVPFLDHRLVEFCARIPTELKIKGKERKYLLRQILYENFPRNIVDRPKRGFAVPVAGWLRGELKPWAHELLCGQKLRAGGYLDRNEVLKIWDLHQQGFDYTACLWNILMFQSWVEHNAL